MKEDVRLSIDIVDASGKVLGHLFSRTMTYNQQLLDMLYDLNELARRELGFAPFDEDELEYYDED